MREVAGIDAERQHAEPASGGIAALRGNLPFALLFAGLVALYWAWILSFPVFPTQDGPIHLYYAQVLSKLHSGPSVFSNYFAIRYPIPPYAVHYLILLTLYYLVTPVMAEKLVICLIIALTSYGFLHLVRSMSRASSPLALLGIPLSLGWTIGMGFHNYGLSLGLSLFAISFWIRARDRDSNRYRATFVAFTIAMLFTHPVPLLMTLMVAWTDLFLSAWFTFRSGGGYSFFRGRSQKAGLWSLLAASSTLVYIALFVSGSRTSENLHHRLFQGGMLRDLLHGRPLLLVSGTLGANLYLLLLFGLAGVGIFLAARNLRENWRRKSVNGSTSVALAAIALPIFYPLIPRSINGSDFFADRLVVYIWFFLIAVMTPAFAASTPRAKTLAAVVSTVVSLWVMFIYDSNIRKVSGAMDRLEHASLAAPGPRGVFIDPPIVPVSGHLTYDPYIWSAARYFRNTNTIMMNAPWLDLPILPIEAKDGLLATRFPGSVFTFPDRFAGMLINDEKVRTSIANQLDFILFMGFSGDKPGSRDRVIEQKWPYSWTCSREDWFALCKPVQ